MITGQDSIPKSSKGSSVRNPAINYARRVIAETYYSRRISGPVSSQDLHLLTNGFAKLFTMRKPITGDTNGAGLTFLLCKHLESFRGKAQSLHKKGHKMDKLTVGGTITGILKLAKVRITADFGEPMPPKFMDMKYLCDHEFLVGSSEETKFYYRFQGQNNSTAVVVLPNPSITSLSSKKNVNFDPPENLLIDFDTLAPLSANEAGTSKTCQKKRKATATPPGRGSAGKSCVCTQDGYREKLIAELHEHMEKQIAEGIAKGLAELSKNFVRKAELPTAPSPRPSRRLPAYDIPAERSTERHTVGSTSGSIEQTRVIDSDEDAIDITPLKKRIPTIRLKTKRQAPNKA